MLRGIQFAQAWIDVWGHALGSDDADTLLRHGVGVKGAVYRRWADRWKQQGRGMRAVDFLLAHIEEIRVETANQSRCPECGTEMGLHAAYCSRRGQPMTDRAFVAEILERDWAAVLVIAAQGHVSGVASTSVERLSDEVIAISTPEQQQRYAATVVRSRALERELDALLDADPDLISEYREEPHQAIQHLAALLALLWQQEPGAYARLGTKIKAPWAVLLDRLEALPSLSDEERKRMAGCCSYIRQMSMTPGGIRELLGAT